LNSTEEKRKKMRTKMREYRKNKEPEFVIQRASQQGDLVDAEPIRLSAELGKVFESKDVPSEELDALSTPPLDATDLRGKLAEFLNREVIDEHLQKNMKLGDYRWGVYLMIDYDGEPIYVGQTNEKLRTRIRRHLTNQRTDAVAMSVLDPFEVLEIQVWSLPQFQDHSSSSKDAQDHLNALERLVYDNAIKKSKYKAILNEKDPPLTTMEISEPQSHTGRIVSDLVYSIRRHPDIRIARRALVISRLSQVISERKVQGGLRRVLKTQAHRLHSLAERRYEALGGARSVEVEGTSKAQDGDD
jgi:hypothetical protein